MQTKRDHGGGLDAAIAQYGGTRDGWLDLSTGINPVPYPVEAIPKSAWTALPDSQAQTALIAAARRFWGVPDNAAIIAAPGASALIARMPALFDASAIDIPAPTYNEHAAAFQSHGWTITPGAEIRVLVHPNNPDGRWYSVADLASGLTIVDESFCDIEPDRSMVGQTVRENAIVLKSFGKFWGLAGLRLGFAIGHPDQIRKLEDLLGPWPVSGPALSVGAAALSDAKWADETRQLLRQDAARLDALLQGKGAQIVGGTPLFRLYQVSDATAWQQRLAHSHIWSRIFPYSKTWLRLGLPDEAGWSRLEEAL
ncbi:threonine-phosphate decarboxylase CobD [Pseudaestuariivita rosea]|uniref:threonine-phosphate decarboxylase CobD n=1 Tax=Pseudaestuariivita rosea TaxID=2763263 RepID=UPI001ABA4F6A|nr:threonine-phosphate decarboxylase CobD [Pseudaestuariivita rosea]